MKLVEFEQLNPVKVYQIFYPEFTVKSLIKELIGYGGPTLLEDLQIIIIILIVMVALGILILILYCLIPDLRDFINKHATSFVDSLFWNGIIFSLKITYLKYCVSVGHQLKYITENPQTMFSANMWASYIFLAFLVLIIPFFIIFL